MVVEGPRTFNRLLTGVLSHGSLHEVITVSWCEPSLCASQEPTPPGPPAVHVGEIKLKAIRKLGTGKWVPKTTCQGGCLQWGAGGCPSQRSVYLMQSFISKFSVLPLFLLVGWRGTAELAPPLTVLFLHCLSCGDGIQSAAPHGSSW